MACELRDFNGVIGDLCDVLFPGRGYSTGKHEECIIASNTKDDEGQLDGHGCGMGYATCDDQPDQLLLGTSEIGGPRYLAFTSDLGTVDARGIQTDFVSDRLNLLPVAGGSFISGSCWDNDGIECFNKHVCTCFPGAEIEADASLFCNNAPHGAPISGLLPSSLYFQGYGWKGGDKLGEMTCKTFDETPRNVTFAMSTDKLLSPDSFRFAQHAQPILQWQFSANNCTDNPLVACTGRVMGSASLNAYRNQTGNQDIVFYNSNVATRQLFDEVLIRSDDMHYKMPRFFRSDVFQLTALEVDTIAFKNRVLDAMRAESAKAAGKAKFDRLDHKHVAGGDNQFLGDYGRSFAADDFDGMILVERVRVRPHGIDCESFADIFIRKITFDMTIRPSTRYRVQGNQKLTGLIRTHVRTLVKIELAARAVFTPFGGAPANECNAFEIINDEPTGEVPPIGGDGRQLQYSTLDGKPLRIPWKMQWRGYHGRAGDGWRGDVLAFAGDPGDAACEQIANAMSVRVLGWPTDTEAEDGKRATTYGGGVTIGFGAG